MNTTSSILNQYHNRINELEKSLEKVKRKVFWYSVLRLMVFLGIATSIYIYYRQDYPWIWLFALVAVIILFLFIVSRHTDIKYQQSILDNLIKINQNEIDILRQKPSFMADGTSFHQDFSYTADLDIFGPRSLYHMINRCFSEPGRKMLASWFTEPVFDKSVIQNRQAANAAVTENIDLRQQLLAHGLTRFAPNDTLQFYPDTPLIDSSTFGKIKFIRWIPPVIMLLSIAGAIALNYSNIIFYGFLINVLLSGMFLKSTMGVLQRADSTLKNLKNYMEPLKILIKPDFKNELLQDKKKKLIDIHGQLGVLQKRYNLLEHRSNLLIGLLLNGFFGYDFIALSLLQNWYHSNSSKIPGWLDEIAWFEALFSLSTFSFNNPTYTYPLVDREMGLTGQNIRHPFIADIDNEGNSLPFLPPLKVILLTGSNMSGKSTFLRSLGVNQVLTSAGSVVAADEFHTGLYDVLTSFRKADSIQEHTSLFYDELKKLRHIINTLNESDRPALILLDEILRGTNSDDKYYGSKQVLLRLKDQRAMTMLATHDIDLAQLEENHGPVIQNYSFESEIRDGELHFDYKLHRGVAVNKNATFLMEKMGIIPSGATNS